MTKKKPQKIEIATPDEVAQYAADQTPAADPDRTEAPPAETAAENPSATAETNVDWKDRALRAMDETANVRKRAEQEKSDAIKFANASFARSMLPVVDDLERTLAAADPDDPVAQGVRLIQEHLIKSLREHRVEPIDASPGAAFDPAVHQAMMQQPSDDVPAGCILQELQKGYRLGERVLRPTQVIVSSGPAGAEPEQAEAP